MSETSISTSAANGILCLDLIINSGPQLHCDAKRLVRLLRSNWKDEDISFKEFSNGYNNKLVACMRAKDARDMNDVIVVRIYGPNTELIVNRDREIQCQQLFHGVGCAAALFCRFNNGFAYRYTPGRVLDLELAYDAKVIRAMTRELAKVHSVQPATNSSAAEEELNRLERQPQLFKAFDNFLHILPEALDNPEKNVKFRKMIVSHEELEKEVEYLRKVLPALGSPVVLCHNDLLLNNILYDSETHKLTFIDFEFAAFNYQSFDIATHFCEYAGMDNIDYSKYPDRNHQLLWLRCYLERYSELRGGGVAEVSDAEVEKLYTQTNWFTLGSHLFWAMWALVQSKYSDIDYDYLEYSSIRLSEYYRKKKELLESSVPTTNINTIRLQRESL